MIDIAQIYDLFNDSHNDLKKVVKEPFQSEQEGIKVIKSKNFYNYVRLSVGATTIYQVERIFSRKTGSNASDKWIDTKKWRNYERGYCVPSTRTVTRAEQIAQKSFKQELSMVLWNVLDMSMPIKHPTHKLFRRMMPGDRRLARICDKLLHPRGEKTAAIRQVCATLTANPSLDRLAILTLFLRKMQEMGRLYYACILTTDLPPIPVPV